MSKRKNKATFITANFKQYSYKEVVNIAENILQYITYQTKTKDYIFNILIGISMYSKDTNYYYEYTNKKGKPKKKFYKENICNIGKEIYDVQPDITHSHIHIIILACPRRNNNRNDKRIFRKKV